jgi:hypothetical protein
VPWAAILGPFVATRLALIVVGALAVTYLPLNPQWATNFHLPPQPFAALEAWARFDACWYITIAERGYTQPLGDFFDLRPAFFPLFPALTALLTPIVRLPLVAALVVSNVCLLAGLIFLWRLVVLDWDEHVARRAIWIYLLFPSSLFLSGAYTESVMLAATVGAVFAARRRRWAVSGLLAAAATLARPVGIVAVVPLLIEGVDAGLDAPLSLRVVLELVAPPVLALAGFFAFSAHAFGNAFAMFPTQAAIRGGLGPPWRPFIELWEAGPELHEFNNSLFDATLALLAVAALPVMWRRLRRSEAAFASVLLLVTLAGSLISFNRLLLQSFPHVILLGVVVRRSWVFLALAIGLSALLAVMMVRFATWNWVA